ncbi:MAG: ROK family protein [Acidimicrobiales bacterium]|nr:ROK family protein [Acidimicrobiales bacterium]RZV47132.1 MAG: ROK family protein [Acidimicrobiales bacterium]
MLVIGFDVGGTNVRGVALRPGETEPLAIRRSRTRPDGDVLVDTICEVTRLLSDDIGERVDAVGLGMAALMDSDGVLRYAPNIPGVLDYPLVANVSAELSVPVVAENDATAATWAESQYGAGVGAAHMAFVALGTGIGTGFVIDGKLLHGANGYAGEAGHITVQSDGPLHLTGARGPWEYFASGNGLGRLARRWAAEGRADCLIQLAGSVDQIKGEHVNEAQRAGEPEIDALLNRFAIDVSVGLADLVYVLDPEVFVLGGGLVDLGEMLRAHVERHLAERILGGNHRPKVPVKLAKLGPFAGAIGAADLAAELIEPTT